MSPLQDLDETDVVDFEDGPDLLFAGRCLVYCDLFTVSERATGDTDWVLRT